MLHMPRIVRMRDAAGPEDAAYLLPLGTRVRAMFKMDFAEALYIAELRSGAAGHFSYRRVAGRCTRRAKHTALHISVTT